MTMSDEAEGGVNVPNGNPLEPSEDLELLNADPVTKEAHPQASILPTDSATARAEKVERHGERSDDLDEAPAKRRKLDSNVTALSAAEPTTTDTTSDQPGRVKGVTPIKKEYLVEVSRTAQPDAPSHNDDEAEAAGKSSAPNDAAGGRGGQKKTKGGQNHSRQFGSSRDAIQLCKSMATVNEFAERTCQYGEGCKYEHDIRKYLDEGKREDLTTFNGLCPIWQAKGRCIRGWTCRFASSHSNEVEREDGRKEWVLVEKESEDGGVYLDDETAASVGVVNMVSQADKIQLRKKKFQTSKADQYLEWLNKENQESVKRNNIRKPDPGSDAAAPLPEDVLPALDDEGVPITNGHAATNGAKHDNRARYTEPPFRASEKRRIYYGPETPVLAPLTTQGNMPFRRLCVSLGAQVTWSEMAMGLPLLQGEKGEWALMKAHESETQPPAYRPTSEKIVQGYDNSKDSKFGVQIAANKPWLALKTTQVLTTLCPHLRAIDLNCGCPIDLVCRQGGGSALLDNPAKLEKTLRGMNAVSGDVPITVKIRMGTKDKQPTAEKLCQRLVMGGMEAQDAGEGPAGVAAITLHGRSKQQRYTRSADWTYISECAALVTKLKCERSAVTDTAREPDARDLSAGKRDSLPYFCGNGDILSHIDYQAHLANAQVDACMIARGALIKPWLFEEIASNQYLDKSASERLAYIEQFVRNGLEYWGSDEVGVGTTRKFLLEWLSFSCRYVPVGILEYLPPRFGDRPPAFRGRSELETLLSSANYKDWIRIRYVLLVCVWFVGCGRFADVSWL